MSGDEKDDEDLDGIPLDGAALLKSALMRGLPEAMSIQKSTPTRCGIEEDDDIDGVPCIFNIKNFVMNLIFEIDPFVSGS